MAASIEFGQKIKELRMAKKHVDPRFTLRGFAEMVGISPALLCKVEGGEFSIGVEKIKIIAQLLEADADELLALAKRVDPDLNDCIFQRPKAMALFLRTASGLSEDAMERLNEYAKLEAKMQADKESKAQNGGGDGNRQ
jgi:HTH-type transcriptional regulator, competence development regulator